LADNPVVDPLPKPSAFRYEKRRAEAVVTLVSGETAKGCFFLGAGTSRHEGVESIGDLLNSETAFFPFEIQAGETKWTVLYNRAHLITVHVFEPEAGREPGYAVARRWNVSVLLTNGKRINGVVRVYQPEGRDRLSDWTRQIDAFRYIETDNATYIVNAAHVVAVTEVPRR
jgi:hypothetical protein